jgi:hypothetical protein
MRTHLCPFYGYVASTALRVLMPSGGNQCALITDAHSPCKQELAGKPLHLETCPRRHHPNSAKFIDFEHAEATR